MKMEIAVGLAAGDTWLKQGSGIADDVPLVSVIAAGVVLVPVCRWLW